MRLPVTLPVTLLVMLESPVFAVLVLGSRTLCLVQQYSPLTIYVVLQVVVERRSVLVGAAMAATSDGDDLDNSGLK